MKSSGIFMVLLFHLSRIFFYLVYNHLYFYRGTMPALADRLKTGVSVKLVRRFAVDAAPKPVWFASTGHKPAFVGIEARTDCPMVNSISALANAQNGHGWSVVNAG